MSSRYLGSVLRCGSVALCSCQLRCCENCTVCSRDQEEKPENLEGHFRVLTERPFRPACGAPRVGVEAESGNQLSRGSLCLHKAGKALTLLEGKPRDRSRCERAMESSPTFPAACRRERQRLCYPASRPKRCLFQTGSSCISQGESRGPSPHPPHPQQTVFSRGCGWCLFCTPF